MNRMSVTLMGSLLVLLGGCDAFVQPPVACDQRFVVGGKVSAMAAKGRAYCDFEPYVGYTIVHTPKVDPAYAEEYGGELSMANAEVKVTAYSGFLCPGAVQCTSTERSLQVRADDRGSVTYSGYFMIPNEGRVGIGTSNFGGVLVNESYGPGNDCVVVESGLELECEENTDTAK